MVSELRITPRERDLGQATIDDNVSISLQPWCHTAVVPHRHKITALLILPVIMIVMLLISREEIQNVDSIRTHDDELLGRIQRLEMLYNSSQHNNSILETTLDEAKKSSKLWKEKTQNLEQILDAVTSFGYLPLEGEWIKDTNKMFAAPICCSFDDRQFLKYSECGDTALSEYEMVGRKDFLAQTGGHGCDCHERDFRDEFVWTGIERKWDANETCHKLGNRKVLMMGDSTMGQAAATLMNALFPGGCQTQFTYTVCDTLVGRPMGHMGRGDNWTNFVNKYDPDIVILSAGPHIYNRSNFEVVINSVIEGAQQLKTTKPQLEVVWKTQQPAGCTDAITTEIKLNNSLGYQYDEFYERDLYTLSVFPRHGIQVIDLRMLYYRSDAHVERERVNVVKTAYICAYLGHWISLHRIVL
jgi:hypothetical protein